MSERHSGRNRWYSPNTLVVACRQQLLAAAQLLEALGQAQPDRARQLQLWVDKLHAAAEALRD